MVFGRGIALRGPCLSIWPGRGSKIPFSLLFLFWPFSPFLHPLPGSRDPNSKRKEEERKREREEEIEIEMGGTDLDLSRPSPLSLFGFDLSLLLLHFPRPNWKGVGRRPGLASRGAGKGNPTADKTQSQKAGAKGGSHTHTHSFPTFLACTHTNDNLFSGDAEWMGEGSEVLDGGGQTFASSPLLLFPPMQIWCGFWSRISR